MAKNLDTKQPDGMYLATDEEKKTLEYVAQRITEMDKVRQDYNLESEWDEWDKQISTDKVERSSDLHIKNPSVVKKSLTREAIFVVLAMVMGRNNEAQMLMQEDKDANTALVFQKLSDHASYVAKEPVTKLKSYYNALTYGIGIRKRIYRCDTRKVKRVDSYDPETEQIKFTEETVKDYDDVDLQNIDPRMFYWDERATSHDDMRDCAERKVVPYSSFLDEYPVEKYPNSKYVKAGGWMWGTNDEKRAAPDFSHVADNEVEIFEYWNKPKDMRVMIANGVVLQDIPNPYRHKQLPYVIVPGFQLRNGNRIDGVGIPELVKDDQAFLDTFTNMLLDWAKLALNPPILEGSTDEIEGEGDTIELELGRRFKVTDVNNYKWWPIPTLDTGLFRLLDEAEQNASKKLGIGDPMSGIKTGGTATENAIAAQSAKQRIDLFFKMLEEDVDIRDEWLKLNIIQQFYSVPKVKKIVDVDGNETTEEEYRKLPIGIRGVKNEFGEQTYEERKGAYFEVNAASLGVEDDKYAQFTVRVVSRSTLPISKELQQQKWNEHLINLYKIPPIAQLLDPKKVLKKDGEIYEYDPEDIAIQEVANSMIDLAKEENDRMMNGEDIPSTQGADQQHTSVHMALVDSSDFNNLDPNIQKVIHSHAVGEVDEQRLSGGQQLATEARQMVGRQQQEQQTSEQEFNRQMALKGAQTQPQAAAPAAPNMGKMM